MRAALLLVQACLEFECEKRVPARRTALSTPMNLGETMPETDSFAVLTAVYWLVLLTRSSQRGLLSNLDYY
jgi:hypothetical protein